MNWDAVSAIGEALGAIGVIGTVLYLAFQIRENTRAIEGATAQRLIDQELVLFPFLAQHANVYRRGSEDISTLDADETVVFEQLIAAIVSSFFNAYAQYQRKLIPQSAWEGHQRDWQHYCRRPGFLAVWAKIRSEYPVEFSETLEALAKTAGPDSDPAKASVDH